MLGNKKNAVIRLINTLSTLVLIFLSTVSMADHEFSEPPNTPTGLTGPITDYNGSYTISWNSSTGATYYALQRQLGTGTWSGIYSGSSTSKAESSLAAGTYSYRVSACNELVCSGWSATHITTVEAAPATPTGLTGPTTDYDGSYTISWNSSARSTSYRLEEKVGTGSWAQIYSGTSLSEAISGKSAGTYSYRVKGCNSESVCGSWSVTHITTVEAAPATPTGLTGPGTDYDGSYTISWNASSGSVSYTLEEQLGAGAWTQIYSGASLSHGVVGNADGTYNYRVKGCNPESVCSDWSTPHTVSVSSAPANGPWATVDYSYDALGRLIEVADSISGSTEYQYDSAGNRTQVSETAATQ